MPKVKMTGNFEVGRLDSIEIALSKELILMFGFDDVSEEYRRKEIGAALIENLY